MKHAINTREERVREILRSGKDPVYFINEYAWIQHPEKGRIQFKTFDYQDEVVKALQEHRFNIVLKCRQLGLSTIAAAYATWLAIFHKDKQILVIATKLQTAMNFIKKVKVVLQELPEWLLLPSFNDNKQSVSFSNGSSISAVPTSEDAGRSESLSLLIIDEAAHIKNFEDIWTGLFPTLSTGGSAILISTPKGVGGQYHKIWTEAEAGQNSFNTIRLPWWRHPDHDEAWFHLETKNMSAKKVSQEYNCEFTASGDTFLQAEDMQALLEDVRQPVEKCGPDRNIWVWKQPVPESRYVISADVSRGDSHDYSTFHIIDVNESEVVAEYMSKIPPEKLGALVDEWGRKYNNALACVENNSYGYFANVELRNKKYPSLYYSKKKGDPFSYYVPSEDELPGFSTQVGTRQLIMGNLEELLRTKQLLVPSLRTYDQLQTFVWQNNKPVALKDSHDDLIMSLAIGAWVAGGGGRKSAAQSASEMAYALLKATSVSTRSQASMPGGIDDVRPVVTAHSVLARPQNVYRPRDASQVQNSRADDYTDLSWLYR